MEWDYDRQREKQQELISTIENVVSDAGEGKHHIAQQILDVAVSVSPPEKDLAVFELIMLRPDGRGGGRSRKAGNIKLNMRKVVEAVSAGVITTVGAAQAPFTIPFAAIVLWNSIWRFVDVTLSESDASLIYVMWMHKNADHEIEEQGLLEKANRHLEKYGRPPLSEYDLKHSLTNLKKIGSIKRSKKTAGSWWLCEWIRPTYK